MRLSLLLLFSIKRTLLQVLITPIQELPISSIHANATCGDLSQENGEFFCIFSKKIRSVCRICRYKEHSIENTLDSSDSTWWQSPSLYVNSSFQYVTVTLHLNQIYSIDSIHFRTANSPPPGNWVLEKSVDGINFSPWQYFAKSAEQCQSLYGKSTSPRDGFPLTDSTAACVVLSSKNRSFSNAEIYFKINNGRLSSAKPSPQLIQFSLARVIRIRLQGLFSPKEISKASINPKSNYFLWRSFYSFKHISVKGSCFCSGHASECILDPITKRNICLCQHNTCGEMCEDCCPMFHQEEYRFGSENSTSCQECNCHHHSNLCLYNATIAASYQSLNKDGIFNGGGVCLNCQNNTAGVNCERCKDGFFKDPPSVDPCIPCKCSIHGTVRNEFGNIHPCSQNTFLNPPVRDFTRSLNHHYRNYLTVGACKCKTGYSGLKCDYCDSGYSGYPNCKPCSCNIAGSLNIDRSSCFTSLNECTCKDRVKGQRCEACIDGYYNLAIANKAGCSKCFCFGVSNNCRSHSGGHIYIIDMENWSIEDLLGMSNTVQFYSSDELQTIIYWRPTYIFTGSSIAYWSASSKYIGNKLKSYGGSLLYFTKFITSQMDYNDSFSNYPDVIIEGTHTSIALKSHKFHSSNILEMQVADLREEFWMVYDRKRNLMTSSVSKIQFMTLLANVEKLLIRAFYHEKQKEVRLSQVSLSEADAVNFSPQLSSVEVCQCPPGFTGTSCESCDKGFVRINGLYGGYCLPCICNNHASHCLSSGQCTDEKGTPNCNHNTTGIHCDRCAHGFYGDARLGTSDACKPCKCPLENFNYSCNSLGNSFQCNCPAGHEGRFCEHCSSGYFGNPMSGNSCLPCSCSGNLRRDDVNSCDTFTGKCLKCSFHSHGVNCEKCNEGYYGNAAYRGCQKCNCDPIGSYNASCDAISGKCHCRSNVIGRQCEQCSSGFWNLSSSGCMNCNCDEIGSWDSMCDPQTGQCKCKKGIGGLKCNKCSSGFWRFTFEGCIRCQCDRRSVNFCDNITGECICPPKLQNPYCDKCQVNSYRFDPMNGCLDCDCNFQGSFSKECHPRSGDCRCKPNVINRKCDTCKDGYFGFPFCNYTCDCNKHLSEEASCLNGVCKCSDSGSCYCKKNVIGQKCNRCSSNSFLKIDRDNYVCEDCFCFAENSKCETASMHYDKRQFKLIQAKLKLRSSKFDQIADFLSDDSWMYFNSKRHLPSDVICSIDVDFKWRNSMLSYGGLISYEVNRKVQMKDYHGFPLITLRGYKGTLMMYNSTFISSDVRYTILSFYLSTTNNVWYFMDKAGKITVANVGQMLLVLYELLVIELQIPSLIGKFKMGNVKLDFGRIVKRMLSKNSYVKEFGQCICPLGYSGKFCEECSLGYFRRDSNPFSPCLKCKCNNNSQECHKITGQCLNCFGNTVGHSCNECMDGFYGDISKGDPCNRCACPLVVETNNFSPTCVKVNSRYTCLNCRHGYEGQFCERCSAGFYGSPHKLGHSCKPCECNPYGSISSICNRITGQCSCKRGVIGIRCQQCFDGSMPSGGTCKVCEEKCVHRLLALLDSANSNFEAMNQSITTDKFFALRNIENDLNEIQLRLRIIRLLILFGFDRETLVSNVNRVTNQSEALRLLYLNVTTSLLSKTNGLDFAYRSLQNKTEHLKLYMPQKISNISRLQTSLLPNKFKDLRLPKDNARKELRLSIDYDNNDIRKRFKILIELYSKYEKLKDLCQEVLVFLNNVQSIQPSRQILYALEERNKENYQTFNLLLKEQTDLEEEKFISLETLSRKEEDIQRLINITLNVISTYPGIRVNVILGRYEFLLRLLKSKNLLKNFDDVNKGNYRLIEELQNKKHAIILRLGDLALYFDLTKNLTFIEKSLFDNILMFQKKYSFALVKRSPCENYPIISGKYLVEKVSSLSSEFSEDSEKYQSTKEIHDYIAETVGQLDTRLQKIQVEEEILSKMGKALDMQIQLRNEDNSIYRRIMHKLNSLQQLYVEHSERSKEVTEFAKGISQKVVTIDQSIPHLLNVTSHGRRKYIKISSYFEQLKANFTFLKQKVEKFRKISSELRLGLSSEYSCSRSYAIAIERGYYNKIDMTFFSTESDNDLLYLGSQLTKEYAFIQELNSHVRLKWNIGGDDIVLEHSLNLSKVKGWVQITAERIGREVRLSVRPRIQPIDETLVRNYFDSELTVFNVGTDVTLLLGSFLQRDNLIVKDQAKGFSGCMAEVSVDDYKIGVHNFLSTIGECSVCPRPSIKLNRIRENLNANITQFDGSGYVFKEIHSWNPLVTVISLKFKTFAHNALLFFASANEQRVLQKDYISLEIRSGHLFFQFDLGNGIPLKLISPERYDGLETWTSVKITRLKNEGFLFINDVEVARGTVDSARSGLTVHDGYYVGGVPSELILRPDAVRDAFAGCLKDININTATLEIFKYSTHYQGVDLGCKSKIGRIATFKGDSYLSTDPIALTGNTSLSCSFKTFRSSAILLYSLDQTGTLRSQHKIAIFLHGGRLHVILKSAEWSIRADSEERFLNDGKFHVVSLLKVNERISLFVDDDLFGSYLFSGNIIPGGPMHVGGLPSKFVQIESITASFLGHPLKGCIKDIIFNGIMRDLQKAINHGDVIFNRCVMDSFIESSTSEGSDESQDIEILPNYKCGATATQTTIDRALQFGNQKFSYYPFDVDPSETREGFEMVFELRTRASFGQILLFGSINFTNFVEVRLDDSKILIDVRTPLETFILQSQFPLSDARWHMIHISVFGSMCFLSIDNDRGIYRKSVFPIRINFASRLYFGGLPKKLAQSIDMLHHSIPACIRSLKLGTQIRTIRIDLSTPNLGHKLETCYIKEVPGKAYFNGEGFAVIPNVYSVGNTFTAAIEIRSSVADGVLLFIGSNNYSDFVEVSLMSGHVYFTANNGKDNFTTSTRSLSNRFVVCDGKSHSITASKIHTEVHLKVDNFDIFSAKSQFDLVSTRTDQSMYIGAKPGYSKGFRGCIREFSVNGKTVDFSKSQFSKGVHSNSCPALL